MRGGQVSERVGNGGREQLQPVLGGQVSERGRYACPEKLQHMWGVDVPDGVGADGRGKLQTVWGRFILERVGHGGGEQLQPVWGGIDRRIASIVMKRFDLNNDKYGAKDASMQLHMSRVVSIKNKKLG